MKDQRTEHVDTLARHHSRLLRTPWYGYNELRIIRGDANESSTRTWVARQSGLHTLFTVTDFGRTVIPAFQLTAEGEPRDDLHGVLEILLTSGITGWELWTWLTTPTGWLSGQTPENTAQTDPVRVERATRRLLGAYDL